MADKPEPDAMVAFFDARIAAWIAAKESYLKAASLGTLGQAGDVDLTGMAVAPGMSRMPIELPVGAFRSKSIPDAIKLYLAAARRKQTVKEIAAGLKDGGLVTTASNFEATVTGALHRLKKDGIVLRFKDGWDLAESYPDHIRNKLENGVQPKPAGKKRLARTKPKTNVKAASRRTAEAKKTNREAQSIDQQITAYLKAHAGQGFLPKQVGDALNENDPKAVGLAFARLTRFRKVTKDGNGLYHAA